MLIKFTSFLPGCDDILVEVDNIKSMYRHEILSVTLLYNKDKSKIYLVSETPDEVTKKITEARFNEKVKELLK